jgi:hypothetical protein
VRCPNVARGTWFAKLVLAKFAEAAQIDALIALAMAAERATQPVAEIRFHGWL